MTGSVFSTAISSGSGTLLCSLSSMIFNTVPLGEGRLPLIFSSLNLLASSMRRSGWLVRHG
jgi:hypothetical protein